MSTTIKKYISVSIIEGLLTNHSNKVWLAYLNTGSKKTVFITVSLDDYNYKLEKQGITPSLLELAEQAIEFSDIINVSASLLEWTENYSLNNFVKDAYMKNVAFTFAAGNYGEYKIASKNSITGYESQSGLKYIPIWQNSPYDFTVGSIKTFNWNSERTIEKDGKIFPTKDAVFELASFSDVSPKFVDFFTYGDLGTSFAAPTVAGLISRIKEDHPEYTLNQIRTVLERNSKHIVFTKKDESNLGLDFTFTWVAQVLDPYDLEKNTIRDGKPGNDVILWSEDISPEDYVWTFDTTHVIDKRTKVDAMFEIFLGENPRKDSLDTWMNIIDKENLSVSAAVDRFIQSALFGSLEHMTIKPEIPEMALIERVQALYHLGLDREPSHEETVMAIEHYTATGENFRNLIVDFVGYYNVDLTTQTWG